MLIGEYNEKAEPIKEYLYLNSTPIAILADNKTYKIYSDHLDTPRRVADSTGNIIWSWNSKPFGDTMADEDVDDNNQKFVMNLRFLGQYFDSESGTHYNINRDYNPVTGRYIQSDPIGFDGGVNSFAYVGGMPLIFIDAEGKYLEDAGVVGVKDANYKMVFTISDTIENVSRMNMEQFNREVAYFDNFYYGEYGQQEIFLLAKDRIVLQLTSLLTRYMAVTTANGVVIGWKGAGDLIVQTAYNKDDATYEVLYKNYQDNYDYTTYNVDGRLQKWVEKSRGFWAWVGSWF